MKSIKKLLNYIKNSFIEVPKTEDKKNHEYEISGSMSEGTYKWMEELQKRTNCQLGKLIIAGLTVIDKATSEKYNKSVDLAVIDEEGKLLKKIT